MAGLSDYPVFSVNQGFTAINDQYKTRKDLRAMDRERTGRVSMSAPGNRRAHRADSSAVFHTGVGNGFFQGVLHPHAVRIQRVTLCIPIPAY